MDRNLILFGIVIILICVGLCGCTDYSTNDDSDNESKNGDSDMNGDEINLPLPSLLDITGDIDEFEISNVTFEFGQNKNGLPSILYIRGNGKNIAGRRISEIKITANMYDANGTFLHSRVGWTYDDLPETYTWSFKIGYDRYFKNVANVSLIVEVI